MIYICMVYIPYNRSHLRAPLDPQPPGGEERRRPCSWSRRGRGKQAARKREEEAASSSKQAASGSGLLGLELGGSEMHAAGSAAQQMHEQQAQQLTAEVGSGD